MRDLTKSLTSYTWALSVFGLQQTLNLLGLGGSGSWSRSTKAFTNVTEATSNELGDTMRALFRSGDTLQRGMVDLLLAPLGFVNCGTRSTPGQGDGGWSSGAQRAGNGARTDGNRGGGWVDAAVRMAQAGADAVQTTVDATARTARRAGEAAAPQPQPQAQPQPQPSAPPSSDPSLGWGPMPR
jgi:hypothetical protein